MILLVKGDSREVLLSDYSLRSVGPLAGDWTSSENSRMRSYPTWAPEKLPDYAQVMRDRCERLLINITADEDCRRTVLSDPRAIHKQLFVGLTPDGFPEYAGTYRGSPDTSLAGRRCEGPSALIPGGKFEFLHPDLVECKINELLEFVAHTIGHPPSSLDEQLGNLAKAFGFFGCIHPFLNGNGHVQRALFAAMATEFGIPLSFRFALHPRPYDILLMTMLELFTRNGGGEDDIARVGEYLRFFLTGDFARPLDEFE